MLHWQLWWLPNVQEGPVISAHSVQVARFLFIDSHTRKGKSTTPKIVEPLNFTPLCKSLNSCLPSQMLSRYSFYCQNELEVSSQRFHVSSQEKKSAVSDFFKFSSKHSNTNVTHHRHFTLVYLFGDTRLLQTRERYHAPRGD